MRAKPCRLKRWKESALHLAIRECARPSRYFSGFSGFLAFGVVWRCETLHRCPERRRAPAGLRANDALGMRALSKPEAGSGLRIDVPAKRAADLAAGQEATGAARCGRPLADGARERGPPRRAAGSWAAAWICIREGGGCARIRLSVPAAQFAAAHCCSERAPPPSTLPTRRPSRDHASAASPWAEGVSP